MSTGFVLKGCGVLFTCLVLAGCGASSSPPGDSFPAAIAEGRAAVRDVMTETKARSVSVALVDGDRVIWSEAFGDAATSTLYGICSLSKMLATVAVMILVDQERVSLDEPITTYIADFTMPLDPRYRDITVRMLLNHSSGLPGNDVRGGITLTPYPGYAAGMMDSLKYQRLKHDPGTMSSYNNDGFTMVENLVKAVTDQEYPDFVRRNIFDPLGMTSSRYQTEPLPENSYAAPYNGTTRLPMFSFNVYGSGGLFSTPEELSRLAVMLINKGMYGSRRILSARSVAAMAQDQRLGSFNPVPSEENRYGLGWDTVAQPGLAAAGFTAWDKTGDMTGYYGANIAVAPEERLAVVVFGASGSSTTSFTSGHAVTISERILLRALVERGRLAAMPEPMPKTALPVKAVTTEEKTTFTGFYASARGIYRVGYGTTDDSLSVETYEGNWTPKYTGFELRTDGWYAADNDAVMALRLLTRAGRTYIAQRDKRGYGHYSVASMLGQRLDDRPALSAAWEARLGERWLPVNKQTYVNFPVKVEDPSFQLGRTDMTGYVMGTNIMGDMAPPSDTRLDGMFLVLPDGMSNLVDAGIETWGGQQWLRLGSYLYRPLSGLALLAPGASTVPIGSDGFAEWRRLPPAGTLSLAGAGYWFLYDAGFRELASGTGSGTPPFSGAGAKYLLLFGEKGMAISLNLTVQ